MMNTARIAHPAGFPPTSKLTAVIFDVDGTLAETECDGHRVAYNQALAEAGVDWGWTPEAYGAALVVAGGKERLRLFAQERLPALSTDTALDAWVARVYRRKSELYSRIAETGQLALRPGVRRLIAELAGAGVRLAIATTTARSAVESLVRAHFDCAAEAIFEVIGAGDCVPAKKPAPDVYRWVLAHLGVPAAAALAVEDTRIGLQAASAAGLAVVVTVSAYSAGDDFSGALCVLPALGEPDAPVSALAGLPLSSPCVDLAQLRAWHAQAGRHRA